MIRESAHWRTTINGNQNLLGKLFIALRRHEESVVELTPVEWAGLLDEVTWATDRLRRAFAPDHFNYAFLQNQDRHVHLHIIPRYAGSRALGGVAFDDPDWPDHYRPGVEHIPPPELIDAISQMVAEP